jgi:hypothetical protein
LGHCTTHERLSAKVLGAFAVIGVGHHTR